MLLDAPDSRSCLPSLCVYVREVVAHHRGSHDWCHQNCIPLSQFKLFLRAARTRPRCAFTRPPFNSRTASAAEGLPERTPFGMLCASRRYAGGSGKRTSADGRIESVHSRRRFFETKRNQYSTRSCLAVCSSMHNPHVGSSTRLSFLFVSFFFFRRWQKSRADFLFSR